MRRVGVALSVAIAALTLGLASPRAIADDQDDEHEEQIQAKLAASPDLKNNRIRVDVDDGIAVLDGTVDSQREKKEATSLAHVDGILGVNNRLQVRGAEK